MPSRWIRTRRNYKASGAYSCIWTYYQSYGYSRLRGICTQDPESLHRAESGRQTNFFKYYMRQKHPTRLVGRALVNQICQGWLGPSIRATLYRNWDMSHIVSPSKTYGQAKRLDPSPTIGSWDMLYVYTSAPQKVTVGFSLTFQMLQGALSTQLY